MLRSEIIQAINKIYTTHIYWGAGKITRLLHNDLNNIGLNIPEKFFIRSADILNVKGTLTKHRGIDCRVYTKEECMKVLDYYFNTSKKQRSQDWLKLHPEEKERRLKNRVIIKEKHKLQKLKEEEQFMTVCSYASKLKTRPKTFKQVLDRLQIDYTNNIIYACDYNKINSYYNSLPKNTYDRGRILAKQTSIERFGSCRYNSIPEIKEKLLSTRESEKKKYIESLKIKYNSDFLDSKEAQKYVARNNSTLITGFKLLKLPLYKTTAEYIYNINDLNTFKDFMNNKTSLKGHIARAFQSELDKLNIEYICEKTFPGLKDKGMLRCDFYVPIINLVIEVQGGQHFTPVNYQKLSESELLKEFKALQNRDKIKKDYFKLNNIDFKEVIKSEDIDLTITYIKNKMYNI